MCIALSSGLSVSNDAYDMCMRDKEEDLLLSCCTSTRWHLYCTGSKYCRNLTIVGTLRQLISNKTSSSLLVIKFTHRQTHFPVFRTNFIPVLYHFRITFDQFPLNFNVARGKFSIDFHDHQTELDSFNCAVRYYKLVIMQTVRRYATLFCLPVSWCLSTCEMPIVCMRDAQNCYQAD